jgi:oligoendopeptidase F
MQAKVKQDRAFIPKVKEFLATGLAKSPKDMFADMGIDISDESFWKEGLHQIDQQLVEAERLAKDLGKI